MKLIGGHTLLHRYPGATEPEFGCSVESEILGLREICAVQGNTRRQWDRHICSLSLCGMAALSEPSSLSAPPPCQWTAETAHGRT